MINSSAVASGLVAELARAWDGLEVMTAIIAARGNSGESVPVLHRLLEAACSSAPELRAAVWSGQGGTMQAVAQLGCASVDSSINAMANATARDGRTRLAGNQGGAATMPLSRIQGIVTRGDASSGGRAVVALWGPTGSAPFDAHMTRIAEALAIQVAFVLEEEEWTSRLLDQERSDADLQAARQIQASLLETPRAGSNRYLAWSSFSKPARIVGGDFHDVNHLPKDGLGFVVGDVMGKGLPAALLGAACLNHILRAVAGSVAVGSDSPSSILTEANRTLSPELMRLDTFASVFVARIDTDPLVLRFADAGHGNGLVRKRDGTVLRLIGQETLMGVERAPFTEVSVPLERGDQVLVFTDGLSDLPRRRRQTFDVAAWFAATTARGPEALVAALATEVRRFCPEGGAPDDDITCVAVGVKE